MKRRRMTLYEAVSELVVLREALNNETEEEAKVEGSGNQDSVAAIDVVLKELARFRGVKLPDSRHVCPICSEYMPCEHVG